MYEVNTVNPADLQLRSRSQYAGNLSQAAYQNTLHSFPSSMNPQDYLHPNLNYGNSKGLNSFTSTEIGGPVPGGYSTNRNHWVNPVWSPIDGRNRLDFQGSSIEPRYEDNDYNQAQQRGDVETQTSFPATANDNIDRRSDPQQMENQIDMQNEDESTESKCKFCPRVYRGKLQGQILKGHIRDKHGDPQSAAYQCFLLKGGSPCGKLFSRAGNRRKHVQVFHPRENKELPPKNASPGGHDNVLTIRLLDEWIPRLP